MPFQSALTSQQKTDIRASGYSRHAYVLRTPQDIVFQATVKDAVSGQDYASIEFDAPTTGAYTDIVSGMTVIVHTDSADIDDTVFSPTYARGIATTTVVNIGWQATNLAGTDTITVLNDYRLHARQTRINEGNILNDYDETFIKLPPQIGGLQSVYAVNQSTTATLSFTPSVTAIEDSTTISSYLWDVGDGTITVGSSSTQNITATFPAWTSGETSGWRYVSLTATDSNSNVSTMHFQVFVGDFNSATWALSEFQALDVGVTLDEGSIGSIALTATGAQSLYGDNHITVVIEETKNGDSDPIVSNIAFVGRASGYVDSETAQIIGEFYGIQISQEHTRSLHGYGVMLAELPVNLYPLVRDAGQSDWHYITEINTPRVIFHSLRHLTTAQNIMSIDLELATYVSYKSDGFELERGSLLDSINRLSVMVGAKIEFARSGEMRFTKDARLSSAAVRNALDTIIDLTNDDFKEQITLTTPARQRIGMIEATGYSYDTALAELQPLLIQVQAPKIPNTLGEAIRSVDYLLASDQSRADATTELAVLSANYLALRNQSVTINNSFPDSYWFMIPSLSAWHTVTYNFPSGDDYDTSTRWLLDSISLSVQIEETDTGGIRQQWQVGVSYLVETSDEGIANAIQYAPAIFPADVPFVPTIYTNASTPEDAYQSESQFASTVGNRGGGTDYPQPQPPNENNPTSPTEDAISVALANSSATATNKTTVASNTYRVTMTGTGLIENSGIDIDTSVSVDGTVDPTSSGGETGLNVVSGQSVTFTSTDTWTYDTGALPGSLVDADGKIGLTNGGAILPASFIGTLIGKVGVAGSWFAVGTSNTIVMPATGELYLAMNDVTGTYGDNSGTISVTLLSENNKLYSDGFYEYNLNNGVPSNVVSLGSNGLQLNASAVAAPSFSELSGYEFTFSGTGANEDFLFLDSAYGENSGSLNLQIQGTFA